MSSEGRSEQELVRIEKLKKLQEREPIVYKNGFVPKDTALALREKYSDQSKEALETLAVPVTVAGRLMAIRLFGKAAFLQLQDRTGSIQLFVQQTALGDEGYQRFKELDLGDIVFAKGAVFKTKTEELSIKVETLTLLTKALHPLPEKFHGIADVEIKYRQRYLDLMTDSTVRERFQRRSKVVECIRSYFAERDFLEVETPMMHPLVGGAAARPFATHHHTLDMPLYLRIAPELYLKRLVVGGMDRVFEINRNFRNEGISIQHNPEFTMLEFYWAYATYEDLMDLTEDLFRTVATKVLGKPELVYQGTEIQLGGAWRRLSVEHAILEYSDFAQKHSRTELRNKGVLTRFATSHHIPIKDVMSVGELQMAIFEHFAEPKLIQPTFVTHYPIDVSPLSRCNDKDPFLTDRFELFIYGREIANGFSELNDPFDQKRRFEAQVEAKTQGNHEACDMDEDYVRALEYGLPPTAGEGIGIDRMVMLFTDAASIRDVILFPQMRKKH